MTISGWEMTVTGTVQGVGFRPFVFCTASEFGVTGSVKNTASGVVIQAFGETSAVENFARKIKTSPPPLSVIDGVTSVLLAANTPCPTEFTIETSKEGAAGGITVPRDTTYCETCLAEMLSETNRRYLHPFINCTQCGPRYSIIKELPYDRKNTTMAAFEMCDACRREYDSPASRRFHAQPTCCHDCGPQVTFVDSTGKPETTDAPVSAAAKALADDKIVAVKGVGGFHLACRADDEETVLRLRRQKKRPHKPLALMVASVAAAEAFARMSDLEKRLLESPERPIVLLDKKEGRQNHLAPAVTCRLNRVGVMLPSSPLHYLLLEKMAPVPLVMTSGNPSGDVLCCKNDEALDKLRDMADFFLLHDRPIHMRIDDAVISTMEDVPVMVRHARGYVPKALPAPEASNGIIAMGGIQKCSIALGRGKTAYVSQYLGNVDHVSTLQNAEAAIDHLSCLLGVTPKAYVHDAHPRNPMLRVKHLPGLPQIPIQHHHAHAAACLGENNHEGPAVCVVFDGTGWGEDDTIWGGEFLIADGRTFLRAAHLKTVPMPGGDAAVRHPGRLAYAALYPSFDGNQEELLGWMPEHEKNALAQMLKANVNCPLTSSMGRLFDSAAALLDICRVRTYEGQPAMELEAVADPMETGEYPFDCAWQESCGQLDGSFILMAMLADLHSGVEKSVIAARFHNTIAAATAHIVGRLAHKNGIRTAALSGGCFVNQRLFTETAKRIRALGMDLLFHRRLPPGDECVSYGQLLIAGKNWHQKSEVSSQASEIRNQKSEML